MGMKSTVKRSLSFGSSITRELSEWLRPTYVQLDPHAAQLEDALRRPTTSSGMTTSGYFSASSRVLAFVWATKVAPAP